MRITLISIAVYAGLTLSAGSAPVRVGPSVAMDAMGTPAVTGARAGPAAPILIAGRRGPQNPIVIQPGDLNAIAPGDAATSPVTALPPEAELTGGHRDKLKDCLSIWDKATHMSKAEWRATCLRNTGSRNGM